MVNFMKLIQNENMKIYRRVRTWIMLGVVVLAPILITLLYLITTSAADIQPSNWEVMRLESIILIVLITIFTAVKAADSVAGEFSWGTIKLLLIRPWSRASILLSKFLSLILFAIFFMAVAFVVTFIINVLFFGLSGSDEDGLNTTLLLYLYQFISLVFVVSFAFMLSAAFRSGGLAIGLSVFLLFGGTIINSILAVLDKPWVKFVPFLHISLVSYLDGGTGPLPNQPMTLGFSLSVLAAYFILFNVVSWLVFCKRDVSA